MRRKFYKPFFAAFLVLSISLSPVAATQAHAFDLNDAIGQVKGVLGKISVPSIDVVGALKTILNVAATTYAKQTMAKIVTDTVKWANTGFNGNPAYVQNPKQFFTNVANETAGTFLAQVGNGKLGFLCSPFQKQIQISLINTYYQPQDQALQCTWTGVTGNMQSFLSDFNSGGWEGWFSMTQVPTNNVYAAGVTAQIALGTQLEQVLGMKQKDYEVNSGFLNQPGDCLVNNPDQKTLDGIYGGNKRLTKVGSLSGVEELLDDAGTPTGVDAYAIDSNATNAEVSEAMNDDVTLYDPNKSAGECIYNGPTKTPGTLIQDGLRKTLGSGVDQIVNAQEFDQIASALMQGLLNRYVLGPKGLFSSHYKEGLPSEGDAGNGHEIDTSTINQEASSTPPAPGPASFTCSASPRTVGINQPTAWSTTVPTSGAGTSATFSWSGDALSGSDRSETLSYTAPGTYAGSVTVTTGSLTQTVNCGSVTVTPKAPLSVSCAPLTPRSDAGGSFAEWQATVTGGSGTLSGASWEDTTADLSGDTSGESWGSNQITTQGDTTIIHTEIEYTASGDRTASIVVRDADSAYPSVTADCTGFVRVGGQALQ